MTTATVSPATSTETEVRDPWLPMIVIARGQMLMPFNVAAIPVSMSGMVESFNMPPTTVGTAVVLQPPRKEENNDSVFQSGGERPA